MTPDEAERRLSAVERELHDVEQGLGELYVKLFQLLHDLARERDADALTDALIQAPTDAPTARSRPALTVVDGGRKGGHRHHHGDDRHGMHAVH